MRPVTVTICLFTLLLTACQKKYEVIMPDTTQWMEYNSAAAQPLINSTRNAMEGVYKLNNGNDFFGDLAALKWSHISVLADTSYHLSGFFGKDIAYFICEGKLVNGRLLFNGYWRKMVSTETGLIHLTINAADGAGLLLGGNPLIPDSGVVINGVYGNGNADPDKAITLSYKRKLNNSPAGFQIAAHRSGGRTSDLLPVSENSVAMILKTPEFGSTGIEVDVRYTKDGVPILYHDNTLNLREVQKSGLVGPIENYSYEQLSTFVRLVHGEKIPTLQEALNAVVFQTQLSFVWLDTKYTSSIAPTRAIQLEFIQKAAALGRKLDIVIGLPGKDQFDQFQALPDYKNVPSLCELGANESDQINARIWAPRFTEGTQNDIVAGEHAKGRRVFVWTIDEPAFISNFINDGHFDGMLSNFPSCVAYNYYVHE